LPSTPSRERDNFAATNVSHVFSPSRLAPWLAGLFVAMPVLIATYPPMSDLPGHEAVVGILRHWGDDAFAPRGLYLLNLGHPNQLFYLLTFLLAHVVSVATACKIVVAAALFAIPIAAARLADHLGVTRWTSLLVAPIGMGWLFFWGLIANILGLGVFLFVLPTIDRFASHPTRRTAAYATMALILLYLAHQTTFTIACVAIVIFAISQPLRTKETLWRIALLAFALSWSVAEAIYARRLRPPGLAENGMSYAPIVHKLEIIPGVIFAGFEPSIRMLLFAFTMLPVFMFARARFRSSPPIDWQNWRATAYRFRFETLGVVVAIIYFLAPANVLGATATFFYHRFLPPAYALLVITFAPRRASRPPKLACFAAALVPVAAMSVSWPVYVDADRVTRDLDDVSQHIVERSAVVIIGIGPPEDRLFAPVGWGGHVIAARGGRCLFDYTQSPLAPAILNPRYRWNEVAQRVSKIGWNFEPARDFKRFRYLLIQTTDLAWGLFATDALAADAHLVAQRGEWFLLESNHEVVPLLSTDDANAPHAPDLRATLDTYRAEHLPTKTKPSP
jgi:hypothetical protein